MKNSLRSWWRAVPQHIRKPVVFVCGILCIVLSPVVGSLPGPGGLIVLLAGIGILASEFDWAENLRAVLTEKVPAEVKKRWRPTPRWELVFDATTLLLLGAAILFYIRGTLVPVVSFTMTAAAIAAFNRNRLSRLSNFFKHKR